MADVRVLNLGEGFLEIVLVKWHKPNGAWVAKDEPLCELETNKANVDMPSPESGVLLQLATVGETVVSGQRIAAVNPASQQAGKISGQTSDRLVAKRRKSAASQPHQKNQRLGTAEWMNPGLFAEQYAYESGTFWLGRAIPADATGPGEAVGYIDDRHICLVSGNRGGKGTSVIINNLCLWPGSVVVVDPKGENATVTAARRGKGSEHCDGLGQAVHVLDPFNEANVPDELRSCFNPLDTLDPLADAVIVDAGRIAIALLPTENEKDRFWEDTARSFLESLILHVLTDPCFEGRRNLMTVRDLGIEGDREAERWGREHGDPDGEKFSGHQYLFQGMEHNQALDREISKAGNHFMDMLNGTPKVFQTVVQVFKAALSFINSPGMKQCLAKSNFKLSDLKTDPKGVSVYLSLPDRYKGTHFRWLRMMVTLTLGEMEATRGQPACGHDVLLILDEFAGLKQMTVIEDAVAKIAGYGVKMFFILQTLEQLKSVYEKSWETFLACSGTKIFFSVEDHFSREHVSKLIGDTEVTVRTNTGTVSKTTTDSSTTGEQISNAVGTNTATSKTLSTAIGGTTSEAKTIGGSRGSSTNDGTTVANSTSENTSSGSSNGSGFTQNYSPRFLFGPKQEGFSYSSNSGNNYNHGSGKGQTISATKGRGTQEGESWSDNIQIGTTNSKTDTIGTTIGNTSTQTVGRNTGTTHADATGETIGINESVQRRALINPDEVGRFFSRIDDPADWRFPGGALVIIHGSQPTFLRRVNYFEDKQFRRLFDPHPDHPFTPIPDDPPPAPKLLLPAPVPTPKTYSHDYSFDDSRDGFWEKIWEKVTDVYDEFLYLLEDGPSWQTVGAFFILLLAAGLVILLGYVCVHFGPSAWHAVFPGTDNVNLFGLLWENLRQSETARILSIGVAAVAAVPLIWMFGRFQHRRSAGLRGIFFFVLGAVGVEYLIQHINHNGLYAISWEPVCAVSFGSLTVLLLGVSCFRDYANWIENLTDWAFRYEYKAVISATVSLLTASLAGLYFCTHSDQLKGDHYLFVEGIGGVALLSLVVLFFSFKKWNS